MDPFNAILLLSVVIALAWRLAVKPSDRERANRLLLVIAGSTLLGTFSLFIANSLSRLRPFKYDLLVYRIDGLLGFQPSFVLGRFALAHRAIGALMMIAYITAPSVVALVYATYLWLGTPSEQLRVIATFVLNLLAAPLFYLSFPVAGPRFAFPRFPEATGPVSPHLLLLDAAPNGVPSIHFATAILILALLWRWKLGRVFGATYLVLIFGATLASGQHYLFDLVAAVPYAVGVYSIAAGSPFRQLLRLPFYRLRHRNQSSTL